MGELVPTYGYFAVAIGIIFQAETTLLSSGYLAYLGTLRLEVIIIIAVFLSTLSGQIYFTLSRYGVKTRIMKFIDRADKIDRALKLVEKFKLPLLLFSRFLYGFRTLIHIAYGLTDVKLIEYSIFNFLGALLWATTLSMIGFLLGNTTSLIVDIKKYQKLASILLISLILVASLFQLARMRRNFKSS